MTCLLTVVAAGSSPLGAQEFALVPAGPRTLSGIVTDTLGCPLADANVFISGLERQVGTGSDGRFRFDQVDEGRYTVTARRIGFVGDSREVTVRPNGGAVRFRMIPTPLQLQTFVTTGNRGGLSGVIGDTSFRAMPGVEVRVMGSPYSTRTDSMGAFFLPVKPGRDFVSLTRDGYVRQTVSVTIPPTEGRKIAAWMLPALRPPDLRASAMLFEMPIRISRASKVWSKFFTREDIDKLGAADMRELAMLGATRRMEPDCPVILDGDPHHQTVLSAIATAEVEFVEVYVNQPTRVTSGPGTSGSSRENLARFSEQMRQVASSPCGATVYAWLRR
jgi:hypothetical protein